jgi:hypothetical protein
VALSRVAWDELGDEVRAAVAARTGRLLDVQMAGEGMNSPIAFHLTTLTGRVFLKGLHRDHRGGVEAQQREAAVNPYVAHLTARILWQAEVAGWHLLAFEHLPGRHADYHPDAHDLPQVVRLIDQLTATPPPPHDVPVRQAGQRWAAYLPPGAEELLDGTTLLHTDLSPDNVLVDGDTARLIDWAWPTVGAPWIDPAVLAFQLIAAGHPPRQAEQWAARTAAWSCGTREAVDAFAAANSSLWEEIARQDPTPWKKELAAAAYAWADYRF